MTAVPLPLRLLRHGFAPIYDTPARADANCSASDLRGTEATTPAAGADGSLDVDLNVAAGSQRGHLDCVRWNVPTRRAEPLGPSPPALEGGDVPAAAASCNVEVMYLPPLSRCDTHFAQVRKREGDR
jgi:hypothetical protein